MSSYSNNLYSINMKLANILISFCGTSCANSMHENLNKRGDAGSFVNPGPFNKSQKYAENVNWQLGSTQSVRWKWVANSWPYTIWLYQANVDGNGYAVHGAFFSFSICLLLTTVKIQRVVILRERTSTGLLISQTTSTSALRCRRFTILALYMRMAL